jgi:hypothetical protein
MTELIIRILFWSVFATLVACLEIEIEGKHGWAEKLPTWYRLLPGGKPFTGYNLFMFALPMMIFHAPFVNGAEWSWQAELETCATYFAWCVLWDYHWFVLNPHYQGKFSRNQIWWHSKSPWVFGWFPVDYAVFTLLSFAAAGTASVVAGSSDPFISHMVMLWGFAAFTMALHFVAPLYGQWYTHMRKRDDREKTDIFHT